MRAVLGIASDAVILVFNRVAHQGLGRKQEILLGREIRQLRYKGKLSGQNVHACVSAESRV